MKKIIIKLDHWLLSDDPTEVSISDRITLYGFYSSFLLVSGILAAKLYF